MRAGVATQCQPLTWSVSVCLKAMWSLLERRPLTRLGMLAKARNHQTIIQLVDSYSLDENEVYFDRDPLTFSIILDYYRTNKLHCVDELCILDFAADLEFWQVGKQQSGALALVEIYWNAMLWCCFARSRTSSAPIWERECRERRIENISQIGDINLEVCCVEKFFTRKEASQELMEKAKKHAPDVELEEDFGEGYFAKYQAALWDLFEKPQSSLAAKVVSIVSVSSVLISTVGMCFNTFEWMQIKGKTPGHSNFPLVGNGCLYYWQISMESPVTTPSWHLWRPAVSLISPSSSSSGLPGLQVRFEAETSHWSRSIEIL